MIRGINIAINAAHPELPLVEATTFVGSPSSVFVHGVPKSCGNWRITAVSVAVTYPDNTTTARAAVESAQGVWVATIPGTATSGRTIGGFRILADGEDENGAAVTGYVLGFADFAVFSMLPVPAPGETFYLFRYFDTQPATPKKGDAAIIGGVLKYYNGTAWTPFADLSNYKPKQAAVADPTASGTATAFIDAITQDANGVITPTKKALPEATTSVKGIVQLDTALTDSGKAADAKATGDALVGKLSLTGGEISGSLTLYDSENGASIYFPSGANASFYFGSGLFSASDRTGKVKINGADAATVANIAPAFSPSATYALNALCVYNGVLYRCTTAITTAEAWTEAHWTAATVEDVLAALRTALDGKLSVGSDGTVSTNVKLTGMDIARLATVVNGGVTGNFMRFHVGQLLDDDHFIAPAYDATAQKYGFWVKNGANDAGTFYALADFAPLASPAFTGTPTAPTAAAGTSTTQVATTAFVQGAVPYSLGTPIVIDTASSEVVEGETVYYGAATLADRTANFVQVTAATALDELRITFPAATSGKVRDFGLRVEIGTGSAALTAPALVPIAPTGETIKLENNAAEIPALADGTATAKGVSLLYFSETAPGVFVVKGEQVEEVA